jgi:hypothetical protein
VASVAGVGWNGNSDWLAGLVSAASGGSGCVCRDLSANHGDCGAPKEEEAFKIDVDRGGQR